MMSNSIDPNLFESHVQNKCQNLVKVRISYPMGRNCNLSIEYIRDNGMSNHSIKVSLDRVSINFLEVYLEDLRVIKRDKLVIFEKDCWFKRSDDCRLCDLDEDACEICYERDPEINSNLEPALEYCQQNKIPWEREE